MKRRSWCWADKENDNTGRKKKPCAGLNFKYRKEATIAWFGEGKKPPPPAAVGDSGGRTESREFSLLTTGHIYFTYTIKSSRKSGPKKKKVCIQKNYAHKLNS